VPRAKVMPQEAPNKQRWVARKTKNTNFLEQTHHWDYCVSNPS